MGQGAGAEQVGVKQVDVLSWMMFFEHTESHQRVATANGIAPRLA